MNRLMMVSMNRTTPCACCWHVPAGTLTQVATYTALDKHDHMSVSNSKLIRICFNIAFQSNTQSVVIRVSSDATVAKLSFSNMSANNKMSVFRYR